MDFLLTVFWAIVAIGVLVTFHEYGHFWVARLCGVKVLRFSVGFGKPLASWHDRRGTEYCVAAIPLGGYVKMLDEREGEVAPEERHQAFTRKSVWQRMAIVVAGPAANFLLAIGLYWIVALPGEVGVAPVIQTVESGSLAERARLEAGQEIVALDGVDTPTREMLHRQLIHRLGESGDIEFTVKYPDSSLQYSLVTPLNDWQRGVDEPDPFAGLGVDFYRPALVKLAVSAVQPGLPAAQAGLQPGDELLVSDNPELDQWAARIAASANQPMSMVVRRNDERLDMQITPAVRQTDDGPRGFLGVEYQQVLEPWPQDMIRRYDYGPVEALGRGLEKTYADIVMVFVSIKKLIVGDISTKNLSGPITIAKVAGSSAKAGWTYYVGFVAFFSVSLGVLNLLPIPVLDGGHLMYYVIEAVKGSPVSEKIQLIGYQVGLVMVMGLMVLALFNDIGRL